MWMSDVVAFLTTEKYRFKKFKDAQSRFAPESSFLTQHQWCFINKSKKMHNQKALLYQVLIRSMLNCKNAFTRPFCNKRW
jgi:hypothetical protein